MSDFICREEAEERLLHLAEVANSAYDGMSNSQIIMLAQNAIHMMPAADVRPNVTGTWVGIDDYPHEEWECDECGCIVSNSDDPWNYWHFCPNCGAKMVTEEA